MKPGSDPLPERAFGGRHVRAPLEADDGTGYVGGSMGNDDAAPWQVVRVVRRAEQAWLLRQVLQNLALSQM